MFSWFQHLWDQTTDVQHGHIHSDYPHTPLYPMGQYSISVITSV